MLDIRGYMTAVVLLLITILQAGAQSPSPSCQINAGAIVRGDSSKKEIALVFTGDTYADGGMYIAEILESSEIKASFFLTGNFYRNPEFEVIIQTLLEQDHYLGAHSDRHLLYCSWEKRDSLLVSREEFRGDLLDNYASMRSFGITLEDAPFFLPPFEWYNDSISKWTEALGLQLVNFSHGTLSHSDYTVPGTKGYRESQEIYDSILEFESSDPAGLNGFILLSHIGSVSERTDKFYFYLEKLIQELKMQGYTFLRIDKLL